MKKSLLFAAAALAAGTAWSAPDFVKADHSTFNFGPKASMAETMTKAATRGENPLEFSYSDELYSATYLNGTKPGTTRVFLFFQVSEEDIKGLAGDKVTGFTVFSATDQNLTKNTITDGRFFYSTNLEKEDYTQDFKFTTDPFGENKIDLDTPYTITGEEESLFFGYSFVVPKANNMFYLPYDGIATPYAGAGAFGASNDDSFPTEFYSFAYDLGALCMSITLEGDAFPHYVAFGMVPDKIYLPLGKESSVGMTLAATSAVPVTSLDIQYNLAGKDYSVHQELAKPVEGASRIFQVAVDFPALDEKMKEDVVFTIVKFNGEANECDGASVTVPVAVLSEIPVHQTLIEEYTGVGCGWCTRGYAALEYIKENEPDFVVAAYHSSMFGKDAMEVVSNFPVEVNGLPNVSLDRYIDGDPYYGTQTYGGKIPIVEEVNAMNAQITPWAIEVSHVWIDENNLEATASVWNGIGFDNETYSIAYILVADGLTGTGGGWVQNNYYASEAQSANFVEELNQFCKGGALGKAKVAGLVFNDVVISSTGIYGVAGSIPASLEAEETATHSITYDLSKIKAELLPDKNKLRVIAAVVDKNGRVLNCAKNEVNDYVGAGVDGISNDENAPAEYYNLNGVKVAEPSNGIFIRRQGTNTEKVVIR